MVEGFSGRQPELILGESWQVRRTSRRSLISLRASIGSVACFGRALLVVLAKLSQALVEILQIVRTGFPIFTFVLPFRKSHSIGEHDFCNILER